MNRVAVWGLGTAYNRHVNVLKYMEMTEQIKVVALTDSNRPTMKSIDGWEVVDKEEIGKLEFDFLIVMSGKDFFEIMQAAHAYGIENEKAVPYRILDIPNIDFNSYARLKKSRISIISNNCWGGIIYKTIGMECLSPFKNLYVDDEDYIKLLERFSHYMKCDLEFDCYKIDVHSNERYPVMRLDDILIHCNHDKEPKAACMKWNRRKQKLNMNNLFVEMYALDKKIANRFMTLEKYIKKICFVPFDSEISGCLKLEMYPGQTEFWETVNSSAEIGRNNLQYNIINLLNMDESLYSRNC